MAKADPIKLPVGRLINESLFVKDKFNDAAKATYKVEMAFDNSVDLTFLEQALANAALDKWGAGADDLYYDGKITDPIHSGNELAARREAKGKSGDAYKETLVIRADTAFNEHGQDAPGGVYVADAANEQITFERQKEVYNGCYGHAIVTIGAYTQVLQGVEVKGLKFYLVAFQKTADGERLSSQDKSKLFEPIEGAAQAASPSGGGPRTRARG